MGRLFGRPFTQLGRNTATCEKTRYQMARHSDLAPVATVCGVRLAL